MMRPLGAYSSAPISTTSGGAKGCSRPWPHVCRQLTIALVPGYETIGLFAPIVVVLGRLCQGFSAGVELGGVSVYLSRLQRQDTRVLRLLAIRQPAGGSGFRRRIGLCVVQFDAARGAAGLGWGFR